MKKIVFTYGLIAGLIMSTLILVVALFHDQTDYSTGAIIGYTTMVAAFTLVYFGVRSYRDNYRNGTITFGRAFGVGMLITLVASVLYVLGWMAVQHFTMPDFYEKYAAH